MAISVLSFYLIALVQASNVLDYNLNNLRTQLQHTLIVGHYTFKDGMLRRKGKLVLGPNTNLKHKVSNWLHAALESGHSGRDITIRKVKSLFY